MADISGWLGRKYAILGEQADTAQMEARARAELFRAQAAQIPGQASAQNFALTGQGVASRGQGALYNENAALARPLAGSEIAGRNATIGLTGAQTATERYGITPHNVLTGIGLSRLFGGGGSPGIISLGGGGVGGYSGSGVSGGVGAPQAASDDDTGPYTYNPGAAHLGAPTPPLQPFAAGTAAVPGEGDGRTDTQPAMLAPGEAVLNRAAAEHLGRDTISLLNALGQVKMGLNSAPDAPAARPGGGNGGSPATPKGYAKGTASVPGKPMAKSAAGPAKPMAKSAAGPAKPMPKPAPKAAKKGGAPGLSPELIAALMHMGGGGGMPAPGPQPMPMAMPMTAPPQQMAG